MLTELRIQNFKAWRDTGDIRMAPITVFFGTNSSGKTSLLQMLLMLKQTTESPDRQRVLHTGDRNTVVELGTFAQLLHVRGEERPLSFDFAWTLPEPLAFSDKKSDRSYNGASLRFEATVTGPGASDTRTEVAEMSYQLVGDDSSSVSSMRVGMRRTQEKGRRYKLFAEGYEPIRNQGRGWGLPAPERFYGFPDEAVAYYQNTGFLPDLTLELEKLFRHLYYLGPLRDYPARSYLWSGEVPEHVGARGERAVEALLAARDRSLSKGPRKRNYPFEAVIARWLKDLGLVRSVSVRPIASHRKDYEVLIKTPGRQAEVNLTDVGFGISQVLPVLVESFYAPAGSTLLLEQPEIHLHPRVQAGLADLFVEAVHVREDGEPRNLQLIIESHSEHFLRRLQRRIAEEKIAPEEVALYFCRSSPGGSVIEELDVDPYGNIRNWPEDFFGDEMDDLTAMAQAAMERQTA